MLVFMLLPFVASSVRLSSEACPQLGTFPVTDWRVGAGDEIYIISRRPGNKRVLSCTHPSSSSSSSPYSLLPGHDPLSGFSDRKNGATALPMYGTHVAAMRKRDCAD